MNTQKNKVFRLITSISSVAISLAGFVLIGVLTVFNREGYEVTLQNEISRLIFYIQNAGSLGPTGVANYLFSFVTYVVFLVTYIIALVFLIKCIVDLARFNKEGSDKRIAFDSLKLSTTLVSFFGLIVVFNYLAETSTIAIGGYLALALGAASTLCALVNYFMVSERSLASKCLRVCFTLVAIAASIIIFMPTITVDGLSTTPGLYLLLIIRNSLAGGAMPSAATLGGVAAMFVLFVVAVSFISTEAVKVTDERRKSDGRRVASIVLTALALVFVIGALFGAKAPLGDNVTITTMGIISVVVTALALVLVVLVFVFTKKEEVQPAPVTFMEPSEEKEIEETAKVEQEPAEEEIVEETPTTETPVEEAVKEEVAAMVVAAEVVEETPIEEPTKEEAPTEEPVKEEKPVEEKKAPAKKIETSKKKEAPKKADTKKAPAKKSEEKKDDDAKKNASYHISKRASDNKWQVFRAGSEKVIKLFDTKVEAEEYTKRMAENQGVGYLSHASKGKNKGRIQKK